MQTSMKSFFALDGRRGVIRPKFFYAKIFLRQILLSQIFYAKIFYVKKKYFLRQKKHFLGTVLRQNLFLRKKLFLRHKNRPARTNS